MTKEAPILPTIAPERRQRFEWREGDVVMDPPPTHPPGAPPKRPPKKPAPAK